MKDTAVLDIDSEEDYELMQILAKYFFDKNNDMAEVYSKAKKFFRINICMQLVKKVTGRK